MAPALVNILYACLTWYPCGGDTAPVHYFSDHKN